MNSEGRLGVTIQWLKPIDQRNYASLKEGEDFIVINPAKVCPRTDGLPVEFSDPSMEWLLRKESSESVSPDYNIYLENLIGRPTNEKDSELVNYNVFLFERKLVRRSNEEIITIIKAKENEANNAVLGEAERNKLAMLVPELTMKVALGETLDDYDKSVRSRMAEVSAKGKINASNANSLIQEVLAGNTPDINSGWEYDNITPVGYPFTETQPN